MASTDNETLLKPLSYIDWVSSASYSVSDEAELFNQYEQYVRGWYESKPVTTLTDTNVVASMYRELIKDITILR